MNGRAFANVHPPTVYHVLDLFVPNELKVRLPDQLRSVSDVKPHICQRGASDEVVQVFTRVEREGVRCHGHVGERLALDILERMDLVHDMLSLGQVEGGLEVLACLDQCVANSQQEKRKR
ncbi:unnamed protein product [Ectocarpus sp. 12 AP-2014]